MILKGKVAVVTGASDGIGKQVALKLADQEVNLALLARTQEKLDQTKAEILAAHPNAKVNVYACDLTKNPNLKTTVAKIISDFPNIDILLNIAGIWQKVMPLDEIPEEVVDQVIATNLTALIHCTRLFLPTLRQQPEAAIINISSRSGVTAQPGQSVYTATKWGVRGFTQVLISDLKDTKIRVAGVYQGGTNTQMFVKTGEDFSQDKFINPADLADTIIFMLSRPDKIWFPEIRVEY